MQGSRGNGTAPCPPLAWPLRVLLLGWTVGGTALFAWTYVLAQTPALPTRLAGPLALSSFLAWPLFVLVLGLGARQVPFKHWVDTCLRTTSTGVVFLVFCTALQVLLPAVPGRVHLALILVGALTMSVAFLLEGRALGLAWARALRLWVLGLQGPFLLLFFLMRGGF